MGKDLFSYDRTALEHNFDDFVRTHNTEMSRLKQLPQRGFRPAWKSHTELPEANHDERAWTAALASIKDALRKRWQRFRGGRMLNVRWKEQIPQSDRTTAISGKEVHEAAPYSEPHDVSRGCSQHLKEEKPCPPFQPYSG